MYTLRLTRGLLDQFESADQENAPAPEPATTRLGDWYVMPLEAGGRRLLLCSSERSLLSVVLPADALEDLPERLVTALVGVLHRLDVPQDAIVAEVDAMTSGDVDAARDVSTLRAMRGLAARARTFLAATRGDVDVAVLYTHLGEYRSRRAGPDTAAARALALLTARPDARRAKRPRREERS